MKNRSTIAVLIALALLLALTGCKSGGSGNVKPSQPPVATDPAGPTFTAFGGMGPWSYERCGKINAADIDAAMSAGQGNIITIKSRTLDTGDYSMLVAKVHQYGAKAVLIAQEGDINKALRFISRAQDDIGISRILGCFIEPDEPDLWGEYDPAKLDKLAADLRAGNDYGKAEIPLGTNFSVAVGLPRLRDRDGQGPGSPPATSISSQSRVTTSPRSGGTWSWARPAGRSWPCSRPRPRSPWWPPPGPTTASPTRPLAWSRPRTPGGPVSSSPPTPTG